MTRSPFSLVIALTLITCASASAAQTTQGSPAQELQAARQALDAITTQGLPNDQARSLADLKRDFDDFYQTFTAQKTPTAAASDSTEDIGWSWRLKLGIVNSDLRTATGFDPSVLAQLNSVRAHLDAFYSGVIALGDPATGDPTASSAPQPASGQPAPSPPRPTTSQAPSSAPASTTPTPSGANSGALTLVNRINTLVEGIVAKNRIESGLDKAGQLSVDRSTIDEMQSAITQLRTMLQAGDSR